MLDFEKLIHMVGEFPTLPTVYTNLVEVTSREESTAEDVARVVMQDQSTTIKLLKLANSSVYGLSTKVDSITKAVVYIGFKEVKNIVMTVSVMDVLKGPKSDFGERLMSLWKHSIATGVIAKLYAERLGLKDSENYFIAGTLHDIGKLFFYKIFKQIYLAALQSNIEARLSVSEMEKRKFSADHAEVGYLLGQRWKLPDNILSSIRYHEEGLINGEFDREVAIVHLANFSAHILNMGESGNVIIERPNQVVLNTLGFKEGDITDLQDEIMNNYEEAIQILEFSK